MKKKYKILIAEDDMDDWEIAKEAFERSGAFKEIEHAKNGEELLNLLYNRIKTCPDRLPDLILLDLNMPKISGLEALKIIKQHPVFKVLPVIVYSTSTCKKEIQKCYTLGATCFVTKHSSFHEILFMAKLISKYWLGKVHLPSFINLAESVYNPE
jgi:CheY-like chemotaxis protein